MSSEKQSIQNKQKKRSTAKVAVVSRKGGVGKSALAREIGFFLSETYEQVTLYDVDPRGAQESVILSDRINVEKVQLEDRIPFKENEIAIYDFASEPDKRLKIVLKECDLIVIPFTSDLDSLLRTMDTYSYVRNYQDQVLFVCNIYRDIKKVDESKEALQAEIENCPELLVMPLKSYQGIATAGEEGVSVLDIYNKGGVFKRSYTPIKKQLEAIMEVIEEVIDESNSK
jgi:MinD-like ATPase involved in chromosome partitioning or flagellar assembly